MTIVHIGPHHISMAHALRLYNERRASTNAETSAEATALWNAIQRADKIAKGLPVKWISTPGLRAAEARLVATLAGETV